MKKVLMMIQETCPYCMQALRMMEELRREHPEYEPVEVKIVDEDKDKALANSLDYWYVPTYYVDGEKVHEGVPTIEKVRNVYEKALDIPKSATKTNDKQQAHEPVHCGR